MSSDTPASPPPIIPSSAIKWTYAVGDECWTHVGDVDGDGIPVMSLGLVVGIFQPETQPQPFFLIQLADPDFPEILCRDALLMSDAADKPPAYMRMRVSPSGNTLPSIAIGGLAPLLPMGHAAPGGNDTLGSGGGEDDEVEE